MPGTLGRGAHFGLIGGAAGRAQAILALQAAPASCVSPPLCLASGLKGFRLAFWDEPEVTLCVLPLYCRVCVSCETCSYNAYCTAVC